MGSGLPASDDPRSRSLRQAAILASGLMLLRGDPVLQERIHILMERTGASMAGVTVIDHDTCWLPICHSASLESISVSESLCATVVSQNKLSLIADLTTDPEIVKSEDPGVHTRCCHDRLHRTEPAGDHVPHLGMCCPSNVKRNRHGAGVRSHADGHSGFVLFHEIAALKRKEQSSWVIRARSLPVLDLLP